MKTKMPALHGAKRRRRNGQDERVKNPLSAKNARPKKISVTHGGSSHALRYGTLDRRTRLHRAEQQLIDCYMQHYGGPDRCTAPVRALIQQAARLEISSEIAWREIARAARVTNHNGSVPSGALTSYLTAAKSFKELVTQLGLSRPIFEDGRDVRDMSDQELARLARPQDEH